MKKNKPTKRSLKKSNESFAARKRATLKLDADLLNVAKRINSKWAIVDDGDGTHAMLFRFDPATQWRDAIACADAALRQERRKNAKESLS